MNLTPDTNVLVRAIVRDEPRQAREAERILRDADTVALTLPCLCELVWVLRSGYGLGREEIAGALRKLLDIAKVKVNRPAAEAGLSLLEAGGDFADGAIAHEGMWLGGGRFVSFDKQAVSQLRGQGFEVQLL